MKPRKNAFSYFVNILFLAGVLYALVCGISDLGTGREYPYLLRGTFFFLFFGFWVLLNVLAAVAARLELEDLFRRRGRVLNVMEAIVAAAVLVAAFWLRLGVIRSIPTQLESDFKTYFEIADFLKRGTIKKDGVGYCEYIAMFPHVYGYPNFLSALFQRYGTEVSVAQYANLILSVATVFLTYRTGRLAAGRMAGLTALVLSAFWPSQVLFVNMVASEFLFSFLLILSVYLFVLSVKTCTAEMRHPGLGVLLHIAIGISLGFCAQVRPMALIAVITIVLCIFPQKLFLPAEKQEQPSISLMILSRGWMRCLIIILCYVMITTAANMTVEQTVGRKLASGSTSFGYNLLVGLNTASEGSWNAEDAAYLYDEYDRTGDAGQAHLACRDLAIQRLRQNPEAVFNLLLHKFHILWGSDEYSVPWYAAVKDEQGNPDPQWQSFLYGSWDWCNLFYLVCVAFAGIAGIFLWKKGNDMEYVFILIFVGTVGMHLFVESQNRYHYHALYMLALLSGCAVDGIYRLNRSKVLKLREEKEAARELLRLKRERIEKMHRDEAELTRLREEAMQSKFDMKDALERNLIKVSVSQAYQQEDKKDES